MTMLSTMLYVVILMIAIVGADKTCTKEEDISHLVQSLQSCANAITGLQPHCKNEMVNLTHSGLTC